MASKLELHTIHLQNMRCLQFLYPMILHLFLFHLLSHFSSSLPLCKHDQASALLHFNNSFSLNREASELECNGYQSGYPKTASWQIGIDCCLWDGVTCETISGYVIGLDLSCSWLQGTFHQNSTLFQLTHLQTLNLAFNYFYGSPMPSHFGELYSLTYLNLSKSGFVGEVPSKMSYLSKLVSLDLSWNGFTIEPFSWKNLIQNATNLRELFLDDVDMFSIQPSSLSLLVNLSSSLVSLSLQSTRLQGNLSDSVFYLPNLQKLELSDNWDLKVQLPKFNCSTPLKYLNLLYIKSLGGNSTNSIGHLKSLDFLALSNFKFSRDILSSIGNLRQLTHLDIINCNLQAPIPPSFWNLTQLTHLNLASNNLNCHIPWSSFSSFQHLTYLDLSHNNFNCSIPPSLGNLRQLTVLYLSDCNLQAPIPPSFWNLTQLTDLTLASNNLNCHIPWSSFSSFQHLTYLDLSHNNFNCSIPPSLGNLRQLTVLYLIDCNLQAPIPPSFWNLTQLTDLNLASNNLNCHIPWSSFSSFQHLTYLDLSHNNFNCSIPNSIFDLISLTDLHLYSNNFSGHLEFNIFSKLKNLQELDLSYNKFLSLSFDDTTNQQGPISNTLFDLPSLSYLSLSSMKLSGHLEFNIFSKLKNLILLDLSYNKFLSLSFDDTTNQQGPISNTLFDLTSLSYLTLSSMNLSGHLEFHLFSKLKNLQVLDLSYNKLTGDISSAFCNASSLSILDLSHNNLKGHIPQCFGNFPSLQILDLQMNQFSGTIPENFCKKSSLETLKLNGNQLEGPLPRSLAYCKEVQVIDVGENNIEDVFPSWLDALSELQVLILRANNFNGIIPRPKTKHPFPKLRIFDVSNNSFNGSLPIAYIENFKGMINLDTGTIGLQHLKNSSFYSDSVVVTMNEVSMELENILLTFTTIDLSKNSFEGEIPKVIGKLKSLKGLNFSHNRISGTIPQSLGNLRSLEWLDLSSNKLEGEIPVALTNLNFLEVLNLSQNKLEGIIPQGKQFNTFSNESSAGNPEMRFFSVSNNKLTGDLSSAFSNASSLLILDLSHNNLKGPIPQCFGNFPSLQILDLQMNQFSGTIPENFCKKNSLGTLKLNGNQLEGPLPRSLAQCKQVQVIDVGENNIKDVFPSWLDALSELQVLILRANNFNGIIPRPKTKHPFPKLRIFDVSNNSFNGSLPIPYIQNFKEMINLDTGAIGLQYLENNSFYSVSVVVTLKGCSMELEKILLTFTTIDFSKNLFEGEIPEVISKLNSLKGLNLSHNRISGTIPQSLGNLRNLEWLDLSSNKLGGEIPVALTNLNFLEVMNLSQNQLEGIIPQGKQFNTFSNESYAGNPKLCGPPLTRKCSKDEKKPISSSEAESGFGWKAVTLGYGCGFVFGMFMGYVVFLIGKPEWLVTIFGGETNRMMRRRLRNGGFASGRRRN